jgi:hypothetical protein
VPNDSIFPDSIVDALSKRKDIFRRPVPENPFARVAKAALDVDEAIEHYNECIVELHKLSYFQFPEANGMTGAVYTEQGGNVNFNAGDIIDMLNEPPEQLALCFREGAVHKERDRERGERLKKPPTDPEVLITRRLGSVPTEWRCAYCKKEGTPQKGPDGRVWHVDHIYPRDLGGDNKKDNRALSCASCNLSKHNKTGSEFMDQRSRVQ